MEWLFEFWASVTWSQIFFGVGMFLVSFTVSALAVGIVMVKIPAAYFSPNYKPQFMLGKPWIMRWGATLFKNILGLFLIVLGVLLSLPGVPGQGILTILLGLIMIDIPGKRPLEARIIKRPAVLSAVNKLRARYKKPPLVLE